MKHVIAIGLICLIIWLIYGSTKLNTKSLINFNRPLTTSDIASIVSTVVGVVSLIVALWSVSVAISQLEDARAGSKEQAAILKKQQDALDRSTAASEKSNETALQLHNILNDNLSISIKQLEVLNDQWKKEQERLSRKPYFDIKYRFTYYVTKSKLLTSSGLIEVRGNFLSESSDWISEEEIEKNPYILKLSNALPLDDNHWGKGSFNLEVDIRNTGTAMANNVHVLFTPLVYGIGMSTKDSVHASGVMADRKQNLIYNPADITRKQLSIFENTQEQLLIPFEVTFLEQELDKVIPIRIYMYSDEVSMRTVYLKFKIEGKK